MASLDIFRVPTENSKINSIRKKGIISRTGGKLRLPHTSQDKIVAKFHKIGHQTTHQFGSFYPCSAFPFLLDFIFDIFGLHCRYSSRLKPRLKCIRIENILHFLLVFNCRPYCTTHVTWLSFGCFRGKVDWFRRPFALHRGSSLGNGVKMEDEVVSLSTKQTSFLDCVSFVMLTDRNQCLLGFMDHRDLLGTTFCNICRTV